MPATRMAGRTGWATPMGRVRFDERGDPVSYERVILQIQDGRHVVVWPQERAQAAAR